MQSPKYKLNKADLVKIGMAFLYSLASVTVAFAIATVEQVDFAGYAFLVPVINAVLYSAKKALES